MRELVDVLLAAGVPPGAAEAWGEDPSTWPRLLERLRSLRANALADVFAARPVALMLRSGERVPFDLDSNADAIQALAAGVYGPMVTPAVAEERATVLGPARYA